MNNYFLGLTVAVTVFGCGSDDSGGRNASRLSELERTTQSGSTTMVERFELKYDGSQLREVNAFLNGAPNGTTRVTYANGVVARIDFADKEGDRAFETFTYAGSLLSKGRYEVTGAFSRDRNVVYDKSTGNVKEQSFVRTQTGPSGRYRGRLVAMSRASHPRSASTRSSGVPVPAGRSVPSRRSRRSGT
jgi:hypothetical protein